MTEEPIDFQSDLANLQSQSLKVVALLLGAVGYLGLMALLWPPAGNSAPDGAWASGLVLVATVTASFLLRNRWLAVAAHCLVWGTLLTVAGALLTFNSLSVAYLLVLPIIFASVLLGQTVMLSALAASYLLVLGLAVAPPRADWGSITVAPVLATLTLVGASSWLSARNLYTALAWVWSGYHQAHHSAEAARARQAELARALKALDEATHRLRRANYSLALARDRAEEARRLKQQFAQTISHELRTPLNLIVGFTELMVQSPDYYGGELSPAYVRDLSIVHRNAMHLQTLVSDVLDLARIDAAQMSLVPEETDLGDLVLQATNTARGLLGARGLWLKTDIGNDLPRLRVDPTRIRQVLLNLLNNAARFTEKGGVTVAVHRCRDEVVFDVIDTGIGIAPDNLRRVFEEFQQLNGGTAQPERGVGLGLAISQRFVELHGGRIWVESQLGTGSTFHFSLPIGDLASGGSRLGRLDGSAETAPVGLSGEPTMLAVTPSAPAAALLTRYIRGYHTVVVPDLDHAERAARQLAPQAVVIDAACDGVDPASLRALARSWALPHTPLLACPLPGDGTLRRRLAADGYLTKPVSPQNLWDALRQFGKDVETILVVDDDRDFVRLIGRMLDSPLRRYQISAAYSGRESLELIRLRQPDLVLLDLMLPDINGAEVIDRVRSSPLTLDLPIVVVSAQDEIDRLETVRGTLCLTKDEAMTPGEIVRWVQAAVDTAAHRGGSVRGRT